MNRGVRIALTILTAAVVVLAVGGAFLFAKVFETADNNRGLICLFSTSVTQNRIKPEPGQTPREFRERVELTREFIMRLNELADCGVPAVVRVSPEGHEKLEKAEQHLGGDAPSGGNPPPSGQPAPPPSGGGAPPPDPPSGGPQPQPQAPNQPSSGPVGQAVDDAQGLVDGVQETLCSQAPATC